ncbi:ribulose-phosphate 3-epimerase [Candidatus Woesearchaeota archaeon]|nr:ribulose-phosphate 3-epimerase [Candidatus Woesearchaeota archaeon]
MKKEIIPAIIVKNQQELYEKINKVKDFAGILQLDVMDGKFVPNESINFDFKLPKTDCRFEAHLMVSDPKKWIEKNYSKVDTIIAHIESCSNPKELINDAKSKGKKIAFSINPDTKVDEIKNFLGELDQVLVMTVDPGFYGSKFVPSALKKIREIRKLRPDLNIEVDGSINPDTIGDVLKAGANMFVVGSFIMKNKDPAKAIERLKGYLK